MPATSGTAHRTSGSPASSCVPSSALAPPSRFGIAIARSGRVHSSATPQPVALGLKRRLGDLLVAEGLITDAQLQHALLEQRGTTEKLGSILVRNSVIT